jgi:hypothetical protein
MQAPDFSAAPALEIDPGGCFGSTCLHGRSELFRDTGLFQYRTGGVPGQDFLVDRKTTLSDRAVPDFVISSARPLKVTSPARRSSLTFGV